MTLQRSRIDPRTADKLNPSDILGYCSTKLPEVDGANIGGAIKSPAAFYHVTASGTLEVISNPITDTAV